MPNGARLFQSRRTDPAFTAVLTIPQIPACENWLSQYHKTSKQGLKAVPFPISLNFRFFSVQRQYNSSDGHVYMHVGQRS